MGKKVKNKAPKDITAMLDALYNYYGTVDIADASEDWTKIWAMNVNVARITPHMIDGLKPVGRRCLFAMRGNASKGRKFIKVLRASSDTIQYHPHGDMSVSDVIYKYGQSWRNNVVLIDSQGNFGNIKGQAPAHPRYPECKLSDAAHAILFRDLKNSNVPMRLSYDGEGYEPDYLPARIPLALCNPAFSSIGVGVATNIPPFNVHEVIEATRKLLKNPDAKIFLVPDSPTGCDIVDDGQFKKLNDYGEGCTVTMSATYEIDYIKNIVTITSIPLQQSVDGITRRLIEMKKAGKKGFDKLLDIQDDSNTDIVDLKLILTSDANPDKFVEQIFSKKTGLKETYPIKIRLIDNWKARVYSPKQCLLAWIEYRREAVRATYNDKLMEAYNIQHMNDVFLMVFSEDNINKTAKIARTSKDTEETVQRFMKEYKISSLQAKTLAGMKYSQFNQKAREEFKQVKIDIAEKIKQYEAIVTSDEAVDKVIDKEMVEIDELLGKHPRKSAIIKADKPIEKVPNTYHLVGISRDGYIKKLDMSSNRSIGVVGNTSQVLVTCINNRDNLLIFGDDGRVSRVGISSIPDMNSDEPGVELTRYFTLTGSPISILNEAEVRSGVGDIVLITKKGYGKRLKMDEIESIKDYKDCMGLGDDDKLVTAIPAGDEDFLLYTNFGDGVRMDTSVIKNQGRNAKGKSLIKLRMGEEVVGIDFLGGGDSDKVVYVTSSGRLKITEEKLLPTAEKKSEPITLIGLESGEYLIGVSPIKMDDTVVVYRRKSGPEEIPATDIPVTTRIAKPKKLVKTPSGDSVIGYKISRGQSETEDAS